jgi:hypothetical protein
MWLRRKSVTSEDLVRPQCQIVIIALHHLGVSYEPNFSLVVVSADAGFCHARNGSHGTERRRTRCGRRRDHWGCGRRSTRRRSGSRHRCCCRSPSPPARAWPLLLASWSLLGAHRRQIASGVFALLPVTQAHLAGRRHSSCRHDAVRRMELVFSMATSGATSGSMRHVGRPN